MVNGLKRMTAPPVFPGDEDKTRTAAVLNTVLWYFLVACTLTLWTVPYTETTSGSGLMAAAAIGTLLGLNVTGLAALRAGYVRQVARYFALGLWAAVTGLVVLTGGVTSPEISGYLLVVMAAGLLSGVPAMFGFSALSLGALALLFLLGEAGALPPPVLAAGRAMGIATGAANVVIMVGLLYRSLAALNAALAQARGNAQALAESNRALNAARDSLEQQVADRTRRAENARRDAEEARRDLEAQMWQTTGQAALNDRMRGEPDVPTLASNVIEQLCGYVGAEVGTLFLRAGDTLQLAGCYACRAAAGKPREFRAGEGLLGQAVLEQRALLVTDVPDGYLVVASALGHAAPRQVLISPFAYAGQAIGAVEIATLGEFTPAQTAFVASVMENVAIAFNTALARARMDTLLRQTQQQAEELQAQEEELRSINEELAAQAESLHALSGAGPRTRGLHSSYLPQQGDARETT